MSPTTLAAVLADLPPLGLEVRTVVDTSGGQRLSGFILAERPDTPEVLGVSLTDREGVFAAEGLSEPEVTRLRDALTAWLER